MKNIDENEFNYWKSIGKYEDFNFWMKKCKGKGIKKQAKILNKREAGLGTSYIFSLMKYDDEKIFSLITIKHILKRYSINYDSQFDIQYEIERIIENGVKNRLKFILNRFPLIEGSLVNHGAKLIK